MKRDKPHSYAYCRPCHGAYVRSHYRADKATLVGKAIGRNAHINAENQQKLAHYLRAHP
jgi:hypothetical protein